MVQLNDTRSSALENLQVITSNSNFRWDTIEALIEQVSMRINERMGASENNLTAKIDEIKRDLKSHSGEVKEALIESKTILQRQESELVDYNDKMDALPWKHKVENDKQTQMLLEALKQHIDSAFPNEKEHSKNLLELNGTVTTMVELLKRQPKQNELVQTIEKQMLFIATTAATNINDRLERISSSQLEQFTNRMDAFVLGQKVDNTQWHETIMQECASQSTVAAIEGTVRNLPSDTLKTIPELIKKVGEDTKDRDEKLEEALKSQSQEYRSGLEILQTAFTDNMKNINQVLRNVDIMTKLKVIEDKQTECFDELQAKFENVTGRDNPGDLSVYKSEIENQTAVILKALEVHVKKLENTTLSTNDVLETMQTHLAKIHENSQKHGDAADAIKKNVSSNSELLQKFNSKLENEREGYRKLLESHTVSSLEFRKEINEKLGENAKTWKHAEENLTRLLEKAANQTQECNSGSSALADEIKAIRSSLEDLRSKSDSGKLLESLKTVEELSGNLNAQIALSFGKLIDEIENLQKLEEAVRQTSDSVIDTKRRVEYGVHQVSTEISNLVKAQVKELTGTLNTRFNGLETSLLDNDEGILVNLTTRMVQEVNQVWKQIGMMHQQMTATNGLIGSLEGRADRFVNSTTAAIDSMKGNIGINTAHVMDMGNNLNNLFGRISLITQEFNLIKKGLGNTLEEMKRSCQTVQNRIKPQTGAGPYPVNRM